MRKQGALEEIVDAKNIGGREQMLVRKQKHQAALLSAKPDINSRVTPHPHVNANRVKSTASLRTQEAFRNVDATFRAITAQQKVTIDNGVSSKVKSRPFPRGPKTNNDRFNEYEHNLHLKALKSRIDNLGAMQERKKNPSDPVAHPTLLFTPISTAIEVKNYLLKQLLKKPKQLGEVTTTSEAKILQKGKDASLNKSTVSVNFKSEDNNVDESQEAGQLKQKRDVSSLKSGDVSITKSILKTPQVEKVITTQFVPSAVRLTDEQQEGYTNAIKQKKEADTCSEEFLNEIPRIPGVKNNDYRKLQDEIVALVLKYSIYSQDDFNILFGRTVIRNSHLRMDRMDAIFKVILQAFPPT